MIKNNLILKKIFINLFFTSFIVTDINYLNQYHNELRVKSWKELRDNNIVKQDLDYSCGSASIATLLNGYYNQKVTEEEILKIIDKGEFRIAYVGITNNLARRTAEHAITKTFTNVRVLGTAETRVGARIIEQNNINS